MWTKYCFVFSITILVSITLKSIGPTVHPRRTTTGNRMAASSDSPKPPPSPSSRIKRCIQISILILVLQICTNTINPATKTKGIISSIHVRGSSCTTKHSIENRTSDGRFALQHDHYETVATDLARAFPKLLSGSSWCTFRRKKNRTIPSGLLYVRVPKAASSTLAGIARRIAMKHGRGSKEQCDLFDKHVSDNSVGVKFSNRDRNKSFLFSAVRNPSNRAISRVFFSSVSQNGMEPTDQNIAGKLQTTDPQHGAVSLGKGGFQLAYLSLSDIDKNSAWSPQNKTNVLSPDRVQKHVQDIIEDYDFLVVVERMDESLVALQLLLGLDTGDILSTASKVGGGYYYKKNKCIRLVKSFKSPAVSEYLSSDEWHAKNYGDFLLHAAASRSLDLTIESLGRTRFDAALADFRALKEMEEKVCAPLAIFPCSAEGTPQSNLSKTNCYERDHGCGYPCIDEMLVNITRLY